MKAQISLLSTLSLPYAMILPSPFPISPVHIICLLYRALAQHRLHRYVILLIVEPIGLSTASIPAWSSASQHARLSTELELTATRPQV